MAQARKAAIILGVFFAICLGILVYLFTGTPLRVPLLEASRAYEVTVTVKDIDNLVPAGQVRIAGVQVGEIKGVRRTDNGIDVTMALDESAAPLHQGAKVRVGARSVVEETYLEVTDGSGAVLPSRAHLTDDAVRQSVQLRDLLHDLDPKAREDLGGALRALGTGTAGTTKQVDALFDGFGKLGGDGFTALDAIAAQSEALKQVTHETGVLMDNLDTSEGAIADLVSNSERITAATAGEKESFEELMRKLPPVLDSAKVATGSLTELAGALRPVAADLRAAGPDLGDGLRKLPPISHELRELTPALDDTLDRAPKTLREVPRFHDDVSPVVDPARDMLAELNPALRYIRPYGKEIGGFFANFAAMIGYRAEDNVHYFRLLALGNETFVQNPTTQGLATYRNPYPKPGAGTNPGPFKGDYPRVERAPR
ncbi:phospholipid/cholesterol/gamma-HCH transport system substrate-binding protein [Pseudonocardia eucalypti]|nr:phospholipid/cholesterol/gamma-HCH transport system substrate-binding protein [Pseudonocardia eucalypti]